jgi:PKD domain
MRDISGKHITRWPAVCVALAMLVALFAVAPGTAYAGWSHPPTTLTKHDVQRTIVKIDGQGTSYAVWQDSRGSGTALHVRVRQPGGTWGPTETPVKHPSMVLFDVAVAPDGTLTALWVSGIGDHYHPFYSTVLYASTRSPKGKWTQAKLSTPGASDARAAVDARGDVVAAWTTANGVQGRFRPSGKSWGALEQVNGTPGQDAYPPIAFGGVDVGLDKAGHATVAWNETPTDPSVCQGHCGIGTSTRGSNGTWSQPTNVAPITVNTEEPFSLAVGSNGETVLAWSSWLFPYTTSAVVRPAGSATWGAPQSLGAYDSIPSAVVGPDGSATVVFGRYTVHVWGHPAKGAWSESTFGRTYNAAQVTSAPNGAQLVTWAANAKDHAMTRKPGGTWSKAVQVAGYGSTAIDNARHALIGWGAKTTSYDPGKPQFASVTAPSRTRALDRVAYAATLSSWLPARVTWHFRDGRTAPGRAVHHIFKVPGTFRVKVTVTDTSGSKTTVTRPIRVAKAP